jgi:hypothetical protein
MLLRPAAVLFAVCFVFSVPSTAESTDCTVPVLIIPDGRLTQSSFAQNTTYWYGIYAQANHSYSVEFVPPADNSQNANHPEFNSISVFGPNDYLPGCRGVSTVSITQNSGYSPVVRSSAGVNGATTTNGAGRRISFIAPTAGLYLIAATNLTAAGVYTFRAVDTTLISIRWNTSTGYDAQWVLMNVSDMPITGTLTAVDMSGRLVAAVQIVISPGGRVSRTSGPGDMNLPRNMAGSAIFSHNGPPNSIMAEAFMIGPTTTLGERFGAISDH